MALIRRNLGHVSIRNQFMRYCLSKFYVYLLAGKLQHLELESAHISGILIIPRLNSAL